MAEHQDLILRIRQEIDNKGIKSLREDLKTLNAEMERLISIGKRNTSEYKELSNTAGTINSKIKEIKNEFNGYTKAIKENTNESKRNINQAKQDDEMILRNKKRVFQELINEQKKYNEQFRKDNELIKRTEQRKYSQLFSGAGNTGANYKQSDFKPAVNLFSPQALSQMRSYYKTLEPTSSGAIKLKSQIDNLKNSFKELNTSTGMSKFQMMEFGENLSVVAGAFMMAIRYVSQYVVELYNLGAEQFALKNGFNEMAGGIELAGEKMNLLRQASSGNLTDADIMKTANKYMMLGHSIEDVAKIMLIAENASDLTGESLQDVNNKILKFIQTGKGRGFEDYGININKVNKEVEKLTEQTGKATDEIEYEEMQVIRTNAILKTMGITLKDVANKQKGLDDIVQNVNVTWTNFKANLGEALLRSTASSVDGLSKAMNGLNKDVANSNVSTSEFISTLLRFTTVFGWISMSMNDSSTELSHWNITLRDTTENIFRTLDAMKNFGYVEGNRGDICKPDGSLMTSEERYNAMNRFNKSYTYEKKSGNSGKSGYSGKSGTQKETETPEQIETKQVSELIEKITELIKNKELLNKIKSSDYTNALTEIETKLKEVKLIENQNKLIENQIELLKKRTELIFKGKEYNIAEVIPDKMQMKETKSLNYESAFLNKSISEMFFANRSFSIMLLSDVKEVFSGVKDSLSNTMQILNLNTDSFVGKLIEGFDRTLSIIETILSTLNTINTVKSIVSTVTSMFTGGIPDMTGGAMQGLSMTGGANELINSYSSNIRSNNIINVQFNSEIEKIKSIKFLNDNIPEANKNNKINSFKFA